MRNIFIYLVKIYQKFFTYIFSYGSCRYYPTCSEYFRWQLDNNSLCKAIFFTLLRILRCSRIFDGGIDYPKLKIDNSHHDLLNISYHTKTKYWFVRKNKNKNIFYVIKDFKER